MSLSLGHMGNSFTSVSWVLGFRVLDMATFDVNNIHFVQDSVQSWSPLLPIAIVTFYRIGDYVLEFSTNF